MPTHLTRTSARHRKNLERRLDYDEKNQAARANKSILLKALAPYYYHERALGHNTEQSGRLILKIDSLPADKKATFSAEEIHLMRTTINQLRNKRLAKGQYTDAADRPTLSRKFCWFCTVEPEMRKSLLLVVTTGFSGILWCLCTVVVKCWSSVKRHIDQARGLIPPSVNYIGNIREKIKLINPEIDIIIFIVFIISF